MSKLQLIQSKRDSSADDRHDDHDEPEPQWTRKGFYEAMALAQLPPGSKSLSTSLIKRFMSLSPPWKPGEELPWHKVFKNSDQPAPRHKGPGAFGGHVFAQAPLAAARVVEEEDKDVQWQEGTPKGKLGIHSIQGFFANPGLRDRPYIYEVSPISSGRSFSARLVNVRQPKEPSRVPSGLFPASDSNLPLNGTCFTCITTFKRSLPTYDEVKRCDTAQKRFADILSQRAPDEWEHCPQMDIEIVKALFPDAGPGAFPILDIRKVDMTDFNEGKPICERRELLLYRLLEPIKKDDANAHIVCHAFEADRNGLLMCAAHLGYGHHLRTVASLSYSFVHVNPEEAVMDDAGWWVQEASWPRVSAGRCMMESKIWSPEGKHVASGYQDGIVEPRERQAPSSKL